MWPTFLLTTTVLGELIFQETSNTCMRMIMIIIIMNAFLISASITVSVLSDLP